jgi:predicted phosphoribosyltransferase
MATELPELRDRTRVFRDRRHAGEVLARMLPEGLPTGTRVLAIPAGGLPVAAALAGALSLPLDVAVVSKVTPSWNPEVGYGAVAFDGRVRIDAEARARLRVGERESTRDAERAIAKVRRRVEALRAGRGPLLSPGDTVVLVDDGLATGLTMETAVESVREGGAGCVIVAVPTGSADAVRRIGTIADEVFCANVRGGRIFAVADAYERWSDVEEATLAGLLRGGGPGAGA